MKVNRVMIAAPKSGSGKTTVTCALLWALKNKGYPVISCKCGPDYIDPMFHEKVIGIASKNLDTFFTDQEQTKQLFLKDIATDDFAVLEGVMGLYDGLGGIREEGSSYHLAKVTKTPIVLVVDAKGMGRSVISLIAGFLAYDKEHLIQGVILNRISKGYYEMIAPLIEEELEIQAFGFLPEKQEIHIGNRHLGLFLPNEQTNEMKDIQKKLQKISDVFQQTVSIENIIEIAEHAADIEDKSTEQPETVRNTDSTLQDKPIIAVAKDEAFCFYYAENIRLLQEYGAQITYFSPLHDKKLPAECHALLIGGGYPELYAEKLSENTAMRTAVREAADNGMPIVAECGGFMYLHSAIIDKQGICHAMAGVLPAVCHDTGKLVRFGYIEIYEKQRSFLPEDERIKGHEFHYYDSSNNGDDAVAVKPVTGKEYPCVIEDENTWMGFAHLYYPSNPAFARHFVEKASAFLFGKALKRKAVHTIE